MERKDQKCGNCHYHMHDVNLCRFKPPQVFFLGMGHRSGLQAPTPEPVFVTRFPDMQPHGWCGEWWSEEKG
jgi:hypothetical protein